MTDYIFNGDDMIRIANKIRAKGQTSAPIVFPGGFEDAVDALPDEPVLQALSVTANNTYTPGTGVDGFNSVTVNVQPDLQSKTATQNGTVTPDYGYDGLSSVVVNVSTGGGATVLSGTVTPTAAQGSDGDIYLVYGIDPAYIVDTTSQIMSTHSSTFRKNTADFALAMEVKPNNQNYKGPVVISPTAGGAAHTANETEYQVNIRGETWYFAGGSRWSTANDSPTIPVNYSADIAAPSASTAQAWAELIYSSAYSNANIITEAYLKVSGAWQLLIGSNISDVGGI